MDDPAKGRNHASAIVEKYWGGKSKTGPPKPPKRDRASGASASTPTAAAAKKVKSAMKSNGKRKVEEEEAQPGPDFDSTHVDSDEKYKDVADWEELVKTVDTIERSGSGQELMVYLTM